MCESRSEKAFNEKLTRSRWVSGQVSPVMQQPVPFVPPPKKVLSAKGKRKRLILYMLALCFAIPAAALIFGTFILLGIIESVPGDHGDDFSRMVRLVIAYITMIGAVVFAISAAMMNLAGKVKE